jgi:hypothetical protein
MSQTISVGVVGPSHWSYMAAVMAEALQKTAEAGRIEGSEVPSGVLSDALEFYTLALQAAGNAIPKNPPASFNAYMIAVEAAQASCRTVLGTREDIGHCLRQYLGFLKRLQEPRDLLQEEMETAEALRRFFLQLQMEGEAEAYEQGVYFEPLPGGVHLA